MLGVESVIAELKIPPLNNSILTASGILSVQVMFLVVPDCQLSPPLGDVTVTVGRKIEKSASEKSERALSTVLVIFIL